MFCLQVEVQRRFFSSTVVLRCARLLFCASLVFAISMSYFSSAYADEKKSTGENGEVNVYSYREPQLMDHLFERFRQVTGIKVRAIFASNGLLERIQAEDKNSPADVILTVDISRLIQAVEAGVTQPVDSEKLKSNIPPQFRSGDDHWFGLSSRARVVYASRSRVPEESITYAELADPKWAGRLCTRSGQHVYSLGLIASVISHEGLTEAEKWLLGVRKNLARKPSGNDRSQIKAIFSGECDIALGNAYYMGLMETEEKELEQRKWAQTVKIIFPNGGRGTHINISGMAMAKHAPHPESARILMEFLSSDEAQKIYSEVNFEYPVKQGVEISDRVKKWGEMIPDSLHLSELVKHQRAASELVDKVAFDK